MPGHVGSRDGAVKKTKAVSQVLLLCWGRQKDTE